MADKDEDSPNPKKSFYFAFWIVGLLIPLGAVLLWDNMPRYKAVRQLREAGIEQVPASVHKAVETKDLGTLQLLHTAQVPFNVLNDDGQTPLIASIQSKAEPVTSFLTDQANLNCDQPDEEGVAPLAHAIMVGNLDVVKKLLLRIQDPNVTVSDDTPAHALLKATQERDGTLLRLLLTHPNIDVNVQDDAGNTPLHHAIQQEDMIMVEALLDGRQQPDPNVANADGSTPLDLAIADRRSEAVRLLLDHGAEPPEAKHGEYLLTAIDQGDAEMVRYLVAHGVNPDSNHPDLPMSLLNYAMDHSEIGSVIELLEAGARPQGTLRQAVQCGEGIGAQMIAAHFDNHDQKWANNEGLLELAIFSGSPDCIDLLLDHGTDPNQLTSIQQNVLALALAARQDRVAERLLEMGADPNVRLQHPVTKEFLAFFEGDAKTLYYLKRDREITPLMLAALTEQEEAVGHLIEHGAHRNAYTERYKRYAVAFAAERHNVPIMQMVLGREAGDLSRKVIVSLNTQRATLYKDGKAVNNSRVSTGKRGSRTPRGTYVITNKHRHHNSSIYGSSMPFFMRLSCGDFGLHYSPSVPSYPASHGCIRMPWSKAQQFYGTMQVGDVVVIE